MLRSAAPLSFVLSPRAVARCCGATRRSSARPERRAPPGSPLCGAVEAHRLRALQRRRSLARMGAEPLRRRPGALRGLGGRQEALSPRMREPAALHQGRQARALHDLPVQEQAARGRAEEAARTAEEGAAAQAGEEAGGEEAGNSEARNREARDSEARDREARDSEVRAEGRREESLRCDAACCAAGPTWGRRPGPGPPRASSRNGPELHRRAPPRALGRRPTSPSRAREPARFAFFPRRAPGAAPTRRRASSCSTKTRPRRTARAEPRKLIRYDLDQNKVTGSWEDATS
jgi:hypothetical protein